MFIFINESLEYFNMIIELNILPGMYEQKIMAKAYNMKHLPILIQHH